MPLSTEQQRIASDFPEVHWSEGDHLCVFRPERTLTPGLIARMAKWLQQIETDCEQPFNRFTDLTKLQGIEISRLDLANVAFWRRTTYSGSVVKSAFLVGGEESVELADAYESFMKGSPIVVSVFRSLHEAAGWLHVLPESLGSSV